MAKNDWIVASINNPDFTPYDFSTIAEMSLDNTQMLSEQEYLKSDFIKNHELFKDDSGNFSEKKFKQFYQHTLSTFGEFQELEFPKGPQLDMFDTDRTKDSRVKDIRFDLGRHINPDRQAIGIEGVRVWSNPTLTKSEIAQSLKIWDTAKGEFKEYSSNDKALSNGLFDWLELVFSDPLVMALWEEDGEHIDPFTGLSKKHRKGDYKLNDKGTYYYETLNNRNPIGKEVLSVFDTLTVDGEGINKYDFFDSDDIEKSISGVIAKNVATLLPLFFPIGKVYSTILIAKEFAKAMPMLYGFATALTDKQEAPSWINNVAAYGTKFTGSTSQYAKDNLFSFENFGNLISDVALQWGLLKTIAKAINKLRDSKNYVDEAMENAKNLYKVKSKELGESEELWSVCQNRFLPDALKAATKASLLGRDASMAYMAIVSNSDLYNEMRERGLTNSEASAIAFGSTLGMFGLNKYTKLGEIFFDDATDDAVKLARQSIKSEMSEAMTMFKAIKNSSDTPRNKLLKYMKVASDKTSGVLSKFSEDIKYHSLGFLGKATGEGLEEVSEELISDVAKEIYQLAGYFGVDTTLKDIGAWDNMLERYSMSLIGGAIGGGIFYGKEALIDGRSYKRDPKNAEMSTLIRNGHANELRAEVEKLRKAGKLGNTKLSASNWSENENGEKIWLTTDNIKDSQNEVIANAILEKINALEAVINNNRIGLSDEELFNNMVLSELRYKQYEKIAPLTNYYLDFNDITNELIAAELDLKKASNTVEGTVNGTPLSDTKLTQELLTQRSLQLLPLLQRVDELRKLKDDFLSGNTSLDYTRKLNFLMDPVLHSLFLPIDLEQFYKEKYGERNWEDLNPEEQIKFIIDWEQEVQTLLKANITTSWEKYKEIENLIKPELNDLAEQTPLFKMFSEQSESLFRGVLNIENLQKSYKNEDDKLDEESDEDFEFRNTRKIIDGVEESDELFKIRRIKRIKALQNYNSLKNQEWVDKVNEHLQKVNYLVDPITYRILQTIFSNYRNKDIIQQNLNLADLSSNIRNIFSGLDNNLSNIDDIKNLAQITISSEIRQNYISSIKDIVSKIKQINDVEEYLQELSYEDISTVDDILNLENPEGLDELLNQLKPFINANVDLYQLIISSTINDWDVNTQTLNLEIEQINDVINRTLDAIVRDINTDPIFKFKLSFLNLIKNPIGELITKLSQKNGDNIPDLEIILFTVENNFLNIDNVQSLILDDTLISDLLKAKEYLKLIKGFVYAASSNPERDNPFGHNQVINIFAEKNKDKLIKEWDILPEIDSDYALLYTQTIDRYISEIDGWIKFSNDNSINKIRKFIASDTAFTKALLDTIKEKNFKITIDDKEFDLLSGFSSSEEIPEIELFEAEKVLYKNFLNALKETNLSIEEFLNKSLLLTLLIPSFDNIKKLQIAHLSDTLQKSDLTDFDLLQYFALVFTNNPSKFYMGLKERVEKNTKVAPIISLEYSTKLAQAMTNSQYRDFIKYAYEKSSTQLPLLTNSIIIPGVAGAGKTSVVLSSINDFNEEVIVAGPTSTQATMLQNALGRSSSTTFTDLLKTILGTDLYNKIKSESESAEDRGSYHYFNTYIINGTPTLSLNKNNIIFTETDNPPKKIFLDEATHLNTLEAEIIDAYAQTIGAVVYFVGDPNLQGAFLTKSSIENIAEDCVFCSRTPKLAISLRDNNLQKFHNLENVRIIADIFKQEVFNARSSSDVAALLPNVVNLLSKLNFHVYNKDVLNGDLITNTLSSELIAKLKIPNPDTSTPAIGFVGKDDSPELQKLREQGIEPIVLNSTLIQGQEFDYVVIDEEWKLKPDDYLSCSTFISKLYTTMTRARTAAIFIDRGLSLIIGNNTLSINKSQAPSILSGVEELRNKKLALLNQMKFDVTEEVQPQKEYQVNIHTDFKNPDKRYDDSKETIKTLIEQDNVPIPQISETGDLLLQTFTDTTDVGVKVLLNQTRTVEINGSNVTLENIPVWKIEYPTSRPLRNLLAFYKQGTEFITYNLKLEALDNLFKLKSCIIFDHDYNKLPQFVRLRISEKDWENKVLQLEIRKATEYDTPHLNSGNDYYGIKYNNELYVAGIVLYINKEDGSIFKFDISGLPSIDELETKLPTIESNLTERIEKANGNEKIHLQQQLSAIRPTFSTYKNNLKLWIDQVEDGKPFILDLPKECIQFNKTTWFSELQQEAILLGGKLDPSTGKSVYDESTGASKTRIERSRNNLKINHPELVFSKIYTYASNERLIEGVDPKIAGRAIVFVSSDKTLSESDLIKHYINQKNNSDENTPVVRMLLLDNYGMTFDQFIDPNFFNEFTSEGEHKPLRQNFNGLRMFVSLWNWRASLKQFKSALETWKSEKNYNENKLNALVEAALLQYEKKDYNQILLDNDLSEDDLNALNEFNNITCKNIPIFRLGHANNSNGFYVSERSVQGSTWYKDKDKVNLLILNPDIVDKFEFLLDRTLSIIIPHKRFESVSLGVLLKKEDGNTWNDDELISFEDAKTPGTLSGLLSSTMNTITITNGERQLAYQEGELWSSIPLLISLFVRSVDYHSRNSDSNKYLKTTVKVKDKNNEEHSIDIQIDDILNLDQNAAKNLRKLMNLVFHGTVEDIHSGTPPQVEDAYYKYGFYINPDVSRKQSSVGDTQIPNITNTDGNVLFYEINTSDELFTVDVNVRSSGIGIILNKLNEISQNHLDLEANESEESKLNKFEQEYPDLFNLINEYNDLQMQNLKPLELNSIKEVIEYFNNEFKLNIKSKLNSNIDCLSDAFLYILNGTTLTKQSFEDYIKLLLGIETFKIENRIVKTSDNLWKINDDLTFKSISSISQESTQSHYNQEIEGLPAIEYLVAKINDEKTTLKNEGLTDSDITKVIKILRKIFDSNDDGIIQSNLKDLINTDRRWASIHSIITEDTNIYNLLEKCD